MNNTKNKINNPKNKTIKRITQKRDDMVYYCTYYQGPKDPLEVLRSKVTKFIDNY